MQFLFDVQPTALGPRQVRRWARPLLQTCPGLEERVDDVILVLEELVTNAIVRGAKDRVVVEVRVDADYVDVEVCSDGVSTGGSEKSPGRWGLLIVSELADSWEVVPF